MFKANFQEVIQFFCKRFILILYSEGDVDVLNIHRRCHDNVAPSYIQ